MTPAGGKPATSRGPDKLQDTDPAHAPPRGDTRAQLRAQATEDTRKEHDYAVGGIHERAPLRHTSGPPLPLGRAPNPRSTRDRPQVNLWDRRPTTDATHRRPRTHGRRRRPRPTGRGAPPPTHLCTWWGPSLPTFSGVSTKMSPKSDDDGRLESASQLGFGRKSVPEAQLVEAKPNDHVRSKPVKAHPAGSRPEIPAEFRATPPLGLRPAVPAAVQSVPNKAGP